MPNERHPWKRHWLPLPGGDPRTFDDYLPEMDAEWERLTYPGLAPLEGFEDTPCLILLGEPGMGKSTALADEEQRLKADDQAVALFNLKDYGTEDSLVRHVFHSEAVTAFKAGDGRLTFLLDSLDEGRINIKTIAEVLGRELKVLLKDDNIRARLSLRVACRSREWPQHLTDVLASLYFTEDEEGPSAVKTLQLTPLRRSDVATFGGEDFTQAVDHARAVPFAFKPITLFMLKSIWDDRGALPDRQTDLYAQGCLALCEETNEWRRTHDRSEEHQGALSASERLGIARHIAAQTMLCQRLTLSTAPSSDENGSVLPLRDMAEDGSKKAEEDVKEVLGTALFRSAGPRRMVWAHQTYAEFLAADFMIREDFGTERILSLMRSPGDESGRVVPQLHETAAWATSLDQDLSEALLESSPDILLNSDVNAASEEDRKALVDAFLVALEEERLHDYNTATENYRRLNHGALSDQLRPAIRNGKTAIARRVAIQIAKACKALGLEEVLTESALDSTEVEWVRTNAMDALAATAPPEALKALVPIAMEQAGPDPDDQLRGRALPLVWPTHLSTSEMLTTLTPPKDKNLTGDYSRFVGHLVPRSLPSEDLPVALDWMGDLIREYKREENWEEPYEFINLLQGLILSGLKNLGTGDVLSSLARLIIEVERNSIWKNWAEHGDKAKEILEHLQDDAMRHLVSQAVMERLKEDGSEVYLLSWGPFALIRREDFTWLLDQLENTGNQGYETNLAEAAIRIWDRNDHPQFEALCEAAEGRSALNALLEDCLQAVPLDSRQAEHMKKEWEWQNTERPVKPRTAPPTPDQIQAATDNFLKRCQNGDTEAWWQLLKFFSQAIREDQEDTTYLSDVEEVPAYAQLSSTTKQAVLVAARDYVDTGDPNLTSWWNTPHQMNYKALGGYKALAHILKSDPNHLDTLPITIWEKWAPAILVDNCVDDDRTGFATRLLNICHGKAPQRLHALIEERLETLLESGGSVSLHFILKGVWDAAIGDIVLKTASDPRLNILKLHETWFLLLENGHTGALGHIQAILKSPPSSETDQLRRDSVVLATVACHGGGKRFLEVWQWADGNGESQRALILALAEILDHMSLTDDMADLEEHDWASLYCAIVAHFPANSDREGGGIVDAEQRARMMRNTLINHLRELGTDAAITQLSYIRDSLPDHDWLSNTLIDTKEQRRRKTWEPPTPKEVMAMAENKGTWIVKDEGDLTRAVMDSLLRFQDRMQGPTPEAWTVWNEKPWTPKDESALSNALVAHLKQDLAEHGVVINREVEIRPGQETDIKVEALSTDGLAPITVIIEVKGCWNDGIETAMKDQLRDRYLRDNGYGHGIYVVGWYVCDNWDGSQKPRASCV